MKLISDISRVNMLKNNALYKHVSDQALVIYLPGYKGNKKELSFLRNFIVKEKNKSFLSLTYALHGSDKKNYAIKDIVSGLEETLKKFLSQRHFRRCYLVGYSLGAALALDLAARGKIKFDKLILISVFDDRKDLLAKRGINLSAQENISPVKLVKKNKKTPKVFIHGAFDMSIVPARGRKVYNNSGLRANKFILLPIGHQFDSVRSKKLLLQSLANLF